LINRLQKMKRARHRLRSKPLPQAAELDEHEPGDWVDEWADDFAEDMLDDLTRPNRKKKPWKVAQPLPEARIGPAGQGTESGIWHTAAH
jgi:hypothetical protein